MVLERDYEIISQLATIESSYYFAVDLGLLPCEHYCCNQLSRVIFRNTPENKGICYRCQNKECRKYVSVKNNTFFSKSNLSIREILLIIFYFSKNECNISRFLEKTNIESNETIINWLSFCREICFQHFELHPTILGGEGCVVELDEAVLVRRKYNQGRLVREQWVFPGYDVAAKTCFCFVVPDRTRETLLPIILEYVRPGSIIYTDSARVYGTLSSEGYTHYTVNHSIGEFVNYETGATTNRVESLWSRVKREHRNRNGTHRPTLQSHLFEFMWRDKFKNSFFTFVEHIKEVYPLNIVN